MKEICRHNLKNLVKKKHLYFTKRCNKSIDLALKLASREILLIQEEGGWITYERFGKKNKYKILRLKQENGKLVDLEKYSDAVLLIHSMPGYAYKEDMKKINEICKKNNIFIINDCCGSIGSGDAKYGDIIVCSFGENKPLSAGGGGFIALDKENSELKTSEQEQNINFELLNEAIVNLDKKLENWKNISSKIKKDLKDYEILNSGKQGINVFASTKNQKEKLLKYCKDNNFEYTNCPRYIRTNKEAISIEVKRI